MRIRDDRRGMVRKEVRRVGGTIRARTMILFEGTGARKNPYCCCQYHSLHFLLLRP